LAQLESEMETTRIAADLKLRLQRQANVLGFDALAVATLPLTLDAEYLNRWLAAGRHGEMHYMQRHGSKRFRPAELVPGTVSVVCVRMNYQPEPLATTIERLADPNVAFVSRYAVGRDYHKLLRQRLQKLADWLVLQVGPHGYRVFTDSAPVMEKALARNAGLGWIGKHTNLIARDAGSYFFLGEIYTDLNFASDEPASAHCGTCRTCMDVCPTAAIVAPFELDARRCISYLTIENTGPIPEEFRVAMGNRIYGCDDCQIFCPWNKFARVSTEPDFSARHGLDQLGLIEAFGWDENTFLAKTQGSAIRRIGHVSWLRNVAVAMGNAPFSDLVVIALKARLMHPSELVREHVQWALARQNAASVRRESC
jgi:epoxyqueuosine reductase